MADLVFPWFVWIMGVSLVLSLESACHKDKANLFRKVALRLIHTPSPHLQFSSLTLQMDRPMLANVFSASGLIRERSSDQGWMAYTLDVAVLYVPAVENISWG